MRWITNEFLRFSTDFSRKKLSTKTPVCGTICYSKIICTTSNLNLYEVCVTKCKASPHTLIESSDSCDVETRSIVVCVETSNTVISNNIKSK